MEKKPLLQEANALAAELTAHRRKLHQTPGTGFALEETLAYVSGALTEMGIPWKRCGKAGLTALLGGRKPGGVFLLRADMDALPMREESGEAFAAGNGKMHACGHDLHTAMLLGTARLLKAREQEIPGSVKLMFQPAEETMEGAKDMIEAGVLQHPEVDAGLMLHVMSGVPLPVGTVVVSSPGVSAAAADFFTLQVRGKGCHGSSPHTGIDPLLAGAQILTALQELHARELAMTDRAALTVGSFHAGDAPNVIPDTATLRGTLRTYDEELRSYLKGRMEEIAVGVGKALRTEVTLTYDSGCPSLLNDEALSDDITGYLRELLGDRAVFTSEQLQAMSGGSGRSGAVAGSEDFAYVTHEIPALMAALAAGTPEQGYSHPLHHPKVRFDESALPVGSAVLAYTALRWLKEHPKTETV